MVPVPSVVSPYVLHSKGARCHCNVSHNPVLYIAQVHHDAATWISRYA